MSRQFKCFAMCILLGAAECAGAATKPPQPLEIIVVVETKAGRNNHALHELGLKQVWYFTGAAESSIALGKVLGRESYLAQVLVPAACPGAGTRDGCEHLRVRKDVDLEQALAETPAPMALIVLPQAGYDEEHRLYYASLQVNVVGEDVETTRYFQLSYREWHCDRDCVEATYEASAKELAAMIRYMLGVEFGYRVKEWPEAWQDKPRLKGIAKWANECEPDLDNMRVIREYGERFWLSSRAGRFLRSAAWGGCNVFDSGGN